MEQLYGHGALLSAILGALEREGKDPAHLTRADLAAVDEFHIGGQLATRALVEAMEIRPGMLLCDIGCGLGGAARLLAGEYGCSVTGIDCTEQYVSVARELTARVGLSPQVNFELACAPSLPFPPASIDGALMLHVGMNIQDKPGLFAATRAVLKPGAVFGIYDVTRVGPGQLVYPVPWALGAATNFLSEPATYRALLQDSGFEVSQQLDRRDLALTSLRKLRARVAEKGLSPLGLHLVMGPSYGLKLDNLLGAIERGIIAPVQFVCRAVAPRSSR